jgi:hypothetical protein
VEASSSGTAAWATDRIDLAGSDYNIAAFLLQRDDLWTLAAVVIGVPGKNPASVAGDGADDAPAPEPKLGGGSAIEQAENHFRSGLAHPPFFADQLAFVGKVTVLGPGSGAPLIGRAAIAKRWKKELGRSLVLTQTGAWDSGQAADGSMVWILANLEVSAAGNPASPSRWFAVYAPVDEQARTAAADDERAAAEKKAKKKKKPVEPETTPAGPPAWRWELHALHRSIPVQ